MAKMPKIVGIVNMVAGVIMIINRRLPAPANADAPPAAEVAA
jgi:hypothetical protein